MDLAGLPATGWIAGCRGWVSTVVSHTVRSFVETIGGSVMCSPDVLDDARASR
jgi:hypothetical protein